MIDAAPAGLCETCLHARVIESDRGVRYWMCRRAATDSRFAKYPRLPVVACRGYEFTKEDPLPPRDPA